ncbi:MAG TPA: patatin-like phospholipase family protein, partial [Acidimicrobiales bacterium]|nr:patatin-like phospholipase family protein [Acidimicrobiales bacterium]
RRADVVIGTSAGSMVAALLRAGIGPADLVARATGDRVSTEARRILEAAGMTGPPPGPPGPARPKAFRPASVGMLRRAALTPWRFRPGLVLAGALPRGEVDPGYAGLVGRLFPAGWPDRPLWLNAVRLRDGRRVTFGRDGDAGGDVGAAVAASCAIPGYYAPVAVAGDDYVDGGAHSPTNADLAAGGPGLVVVSSPMSVGRGALRPSTALVGRLTHRATLQREVAALRRQGRSVVTFQPGAEDLAVMGGGANALDAGRRDRVARQARESTLRRLDAPALREALVALH